MGETIISLDQNAWIKLARADYNPGKDPAVDDTLRLLVNRRNDRSCILPLTLQRLQETMKIGDPIRRERLARFMVDLSSGCTSGCADERLLGMECHNYLVDYFRLEEHKYDIRKELLGVGLAGIFGDRVHLNEERIVDLPAELMNDTSPYTRERKELYVALSDKDITGRHYLKMIDAFETLAKQEIERNMQVFRRMKERGSKDKLRKEEIKAFALEIVLPAVAELCRSLGVDFGNWHGDEDEYLEQTVNSIPSVKVTLELAVGRDKQCGGKIKVNDFRDVSFLAAAIPYADVIVTDRYWTDMVSKTGLRKVYGAEVLSDVRHLSEIL